MQPRNQKIRQFKLTNTQWNGQNYPLIDGRKIKIYMPDQLQKNKYLIKLQGTLPLIVIKKMINKSYTRKKSDREKLQVIIKKKKKLLMPRICMRVLFFANILLIASTTNVPYNTHKNVRCSLQYLQFKTFRHFPPQLLRKRASPLTKILASCFLHSSHIYA